MELDLEGQYADRAYALLASLVTPRPIAWVTTINPEGAVNAAPFSFFNLLGAEPPILGFCPGDRDDGTPKDTARNIRLTHEFVVNLVDEELAEAMNKTAASVPYGVSELDLAGLSTAPSSVVKPPALRRRRRASNVRNGGRCKSATTASSSAWSSACMSGTRFLIPKPSAFAASIFMSSAAWPARIGIAERAIVSRWCGRSRRFRGVGILIDRSASFGLDCARAPFLPWIFLPLTPTRPHPCPRRYASAPSTPTAAWSCFCSWPKN